MITAYAVVHTYPQKSVETSQSVFSKFKLSSLLILPFFL